MGGTVAKPNPPDGNEEGEDAPPISTTTATNPLVGDECVVSDDDSPTTSVTWENKLDCFSEVYIVDLYSGKD